MSLDAVPPQHLALKETEFYSQCTVDVIADQISEIDVAWCRSFHKVNTT